MKTPANQVRCPDCRGAVRRSGRKLICENRLCAKVSEVSDVTFTCPKCGDPAIVHRMSGSGKWITQPGTRNRKILQGDMLIMCVNRHVSSIDRPPELSPVGKKRPARPRGFYFSGGRG